MLKEELQDGLMTSYNFIDNFIALTGMERKQLAVETSRK